jgi:hypothetical protein
MPAHQRNRRAHPNADAPRAGESRLNRFPHLAAGRRLLAVVTSAILGVASGANAAASSAAALPAVAAGAGPLDASSAAAIDLVHLYRLQSGAPADTAAALRRLERGLAALRLPGAPGALDAGFVDAPPAGETELLLRLRMLEALADGVQQVHPGLECAWRADSLALALAPLAAELLPDTSAVVPLAAGLRPDRGSTRTLVASMRDLASRTSAAGTPAVDGVRAFWLAQVNATAGGAAIPLAGEPNDGGWVSAGETLRRSIQEGQRLPILADDPGRRLRLGVRALCTDGVIPVRALELARVAGGPIIIDPAAYARERACLDSLALLLDNGLARNQAILGSRHDYYRRPGQSAPTLSPRLEAAARDVCRTAMQALQSRWGERVARAAGIELLAEPEPVEVVPGQTARIVWSVAATESVHVEEIRARFGSDTLAVRPVRLRLPPGETSSLRSRYAALPAIPVGGRVSTEARLQFTLPGWGPVETSERVVLRVVAPVQASLLPVDDPLVHGNTKSVEFYVTSRAPHPISGIVRVLPTTDWSVLPAQNFRYELRRPGQSARQRIDLALPAAASPGNYELAVRLEVEGQPVGLLRTRLVKPMQWVTVGPFTPPATGRRLPPENGVSIGTRYAGLDGVQVAWQAVPAEAYDPDGSLDLEALYPGVGKPACACAFTVIESPAALAGTVRPSGAARSWWNGEPVSADGRVRIEQGRNSLLLRACWRGTGSTLGAEIGDANGEPLRVMANQLAQLLDGYGDLTTATTPQATAPTVTDRVVLVRYHPSAEAQEVAVLGTFNAWVPVDLEPQPDGTWVRQLRLAPGRYAYKLLVDGRLRPDPEAAATEPDGFGGLNSLLLVR